MKLVALKAVDDVSIAVGNEYRRDDVLNSDAKLRYGFDCRRVLGGRRVGGFRSRGFWGRRLGQGDRRYYHSESDSLHHRSRLSSAVDTPPGSWAVRPFSRSCTCGTNSKIAFNDSSAPFGEPGKATIRVFSATPARLRER